MLLVHFVAIGSQSFAAQSNVVVLPLPPPGEIDWQPLSFRSIEKQTTYSVVRDPDDRPAFRAVSECSASALVVPLPEDFSLARTPRLAWRWKIERGLEIDEESVKAGDDFAARVYVLFRFDVARASLWARLEHQLGAQLFGVEMPGQAINYVWSSSTPIGQSWTSPDHASARLVALESDSGEISSRAWRESIVDLVADARRLFDPSRDLKPYALGLMTDTDAVCQSAIAWFSDFRLLGPESKRSPPALPAVP